MPRPFPAALLAAAVIALAACGGTDDDAQASPTTAPTTANAPTGAADEPTSPSEPADQSPTAAPEPAPDDAQLVELTVTGGEISGDTGRVEMPLGTDVQLTVTSDTADELHVHGFELTAALPAGETVQLRFVADRAGVFEVELHDARRVLTRLQVS
jgi:hypothetical protein